MAGLQQQHTSMGQLSHCQSAPKYSFKGRQEPSRKTETPGPGSYSSADQGHRSSSPKFGFGCTPRDVANVRPASAPGPGQYSPSTNHTKQASAQFGFGTSVRKSAARRSEPGPGAYTLSPRMGADGPKFSAGSRQSDSRSAHASPGPGAYGDVSPDSSKMERAPNHSFGSSSREGAAREHSPGPGAYTSTNATKKGAAEYGFGGLSGRKDTIDRRGGPGPGAYEHATRLGNEGPKNSMGSGRVANYKPVGPQTPGPGAYGTSENNRHKFEGAPSYGFGASPRDNTKGVVAPGPGQYSPSADPSKPAQPGHGFGTSQRKSAPHRDMEPGPGAYNSQPKIGVDGPKFSAGVRQETKSSPSATSPGPGSYHHEGAHAAGKAASPKFGFGTAERKVHNGINGPGPGSYMEKPTFTGSKISFGQRVICTQEVPTPGPGAHNHCSIFA